jgi:hypothetical protein
MIAVVYIYYFYFLDSQKFLPVVRFQRNETTMEFFMHYKSNLDLLPP